MYFVDTDHDIVKIHSSEESIRTTVDLLNDGGDSGENDDDDDDDFSSALSRMSLDSEELQQTATKNDEEVIALPSTIYVLNEDHNISTGSLDMPLPLSQRLAKHSKSSLSGHTKCKLSCEKLNKKKEKDLSKGIVKDVIAQEINKTKHNDMEKSNREKETVSCKEFNVVDDAKGYSESGRSHNGPLATTNKIDDIETIDGKEMFHTKSLEQELYTSVMGDVSNEHFHIGDSLDNFEFDSIDNGNELIQSDHGESHIDGCKNNDPINSENSNVLGSWNRGDTVQTLGKHDDIPPNKIEKSKHPDSSKNWCLPSATAQTFGSAEHNGKTVNYHASIVSKKNFTSSKTFCKEEKNNPKILHCVEFSSSDSEGEDSWLLEDSRKCATKKAQMSIKLKAEKHIIHENMSEGVYLDTGATKTLFHHSGHRVNIEPQKLDEGSAEKATKRAAKLQANSEKHEEDCSSSAIVRKTMSSKSVAQSINNDSAAVANPAKPVCITTKPVSNQAKAAFNSDKPVSKPVKLEPNLTNTSSDEEFEVILLTPGKSHLDEKKQLGKHIIEAIDDTLNPMGTCSSHFEEKENQVKSSQASHVESPLFVPMSLSARLGKHLHGQHNALSTLRTLSTNSD